MCGNGYSNDENISIYLGYYGADLRVDDLVYCVEGDGKNETTKEQMIKYIKQLYTYDEFITKILECIDNGSEE